MFKRPGQRPVTIEEMDEATAEGDLPSGFVRRRQRKRRMFSHPNI
jgi:hypothetical protein